MLLPDMVKHWAPVLVISVSLAAATAGCGSTYGRMQSELAISPFDVLARRAAELPRETSWIPTSRPDEPVVRIALHRTGTPDAQGPILVFIHGAFSDASAWRYLVGELGVECTLWLIDLPGCGASDWPAPSQLAADGYGPTAMADRTYQAIAGALASEGSGRPIILVGHSLGAAIAIRMMADPSLAMAYGCTRQRVEGMILVTPLDIAIEKPIPVMEYVARVDGLNVGVGQIAGALRERMARGVIDSYSDPSHAPREEVDRGMRIIATSGLRRATQAMILQATPRRPGKARPDWATVDRLVEQYRNIDVPVRITCGAHDETFPASMSYKLAAQIPTARLQVIPDCMHSPHLERPRECVAIFRDFLERLPPRRALINAGPASCATRSRGATWACARSSRDGHRPPDREAPARPMEASHGQAVQAQGACGRSWPRSAGSASRRTNQAAGPCEAPHPAVVPVAMKKRPRSRSRLPPSPRE